MRSGAGHGGHRTRPGIGRRAGRTALHALPGADALVGGYTAQQYDTLRAAERDRTVIVPVVLAVILAILVLLLRSFAVPVLLMLTVALNFIATLGVAASVFRGLFGFRAAVRVRLPGPARLRHGARHLRGAGRNPSRVPGADLPVPALVRDAGNRVWWPTTG